jgi:hypothetical protein
MKKLLMFVGVIIISAFFLPTCDMSDNSVGGSLTVGISDNKKFDDNWNIEDGFNILKINYGYFISYNNGWVYAQYGESFLNYSLHRMRPDGSQKQKIQHADGLYGGVYHDGWFYYIDEIYMSIGWDYIFPGQYSKLCRMRPDGSQKTELANDVYSFEIIGEWIYYRSDYSIYKMKTDSSNNKKIINNCSYYLIADGYVFATSGGIGGGAAQYDTKLVRYDMDGNGKILIESDRIVYTPVFTDGEYIYYRLYFGEAYLNYFNNGYVDTNDRKSEQLHRMKFDGSDRQTVLEHEGKSSSFPAIYLKDGFIYYSRSFDTRIDGIDIGYPWFVTEIYKIRSDGTDRIKIRDAETYSGSNFDLIGNSIFYTTSSGTVGKYSGILLHHLSLDGKHSIVYDTRGNEYFSGYFIHNRKLYIVLGL